MNIWIPEETLRALRAMTARIAAIERTTKAVQELSRQITASLQWMQRPVALNFRFRPEDLRPVEYGSVVPIEPPDLSSLIRSECWRCRERGATNGDGRCDSCSGYA